MRGPMSTGEVLHTRVDSLQWEVNRLDSENQRLRSQNPGSISRFELEDELQRVKEDAAKVQQLLDPACEEMERAKCRLAELETEREEHESAAQRREQAEETLRS